MPPAIELQILRAGDGQYYPKQGETVAARILVENSRGHQVNGMLALSEVMGATANLYNTQAQRVGPLPAGRYKVTAMADDGRVSIHVRGVAIEKGRVGDTIQCRLRTSDPRDRTAWFDAEVVGPGRVRLPRD